MADQKRGWRPLNFDINLPSDQVVDFVLGLEIFMYLNQAVAVFIHLKIKLIKL